MDAMATMNEWCGRCDASRERRHANVNDEGTGSLWRGEFIVQFPG